MKPLLTLVLLAGCTEAVAPPPSIHPPAGWSKVKPGPPPLPMEAPARVVGGPGTVTWVSAPLKGTVTRVHVRVGDSVDAGAPLFEVVMPELLDAAARAEGAQARVQAWTDRHAQLVQLRTDGLARSLEVFEASSKLAEARAELQSARALLLTAAVSEREAARLLGGTGAVSLRAPTTGVVVALPISVGEHREPAGGPLAQLSSEGPVRVEARFAQPPAGARAARFLGTGEPCPLTLLSRAPAADPRDGSFLVWFEPSCAIRAGTVGKVTLEGPPSTGLFRVPARALRRVDGAAQVEIRRGAVAVTVERCEESDCLVRGALTLDDEVNAR